MKKVLAIVTAVTVLALGAIAFAHGPGYGGNMGYGYGGHMMGPGYGNHMGYGYGGHMMNWTGGEADQKFLDETKDLRKELHQKRFDYMEAVRNPKTDEKTITKLEKEINDLQEKLYAKAPRTPRGFGRGPCWQ
jgi:Spy/CpxP family protein refolding chaperone